MPVDNSALNAPLELYLPGPQGPAGPQGQTGATGPQGPQGPIGNTGPQGIQGPIGNTGLAGPQGIQGIPGPQGIQGNTGLAGSVWYTGASAPSNSLGVINDWYLNSTTGDVYLKGSSVWAYQSNIKGPQGLTGPQGSTGLQGPTGSIGPSGPTGPQGPSGQGVPTGGSQYQVLTKNSSSDFDTSWTFAGLSQAQADLRYLQLSGGSLSGELILAADPVNNMDAVTKQYVDNLQSQITALSAALSQLNQQVQTIATNQAADELTLADHESRITVLENEANNSTAPVDPFIGAVVHVVDNNGHCQPAVVYEDWSAQNSKDTVSVVVVSPDRLSVSEWDSKIEVQMEQAKTNGEIPFNFWHWPERYYSQRKLQIFR